MARNLSRDLALSYLLPLVLHRQPVVSMQSGAVVDAKWRSGLEKFCFIFASSLFEWKLCAYSFVL